MRIKFGEVEINQLSKDHLIDCLDSNHVTMGSKTSLLEEKWSKLFGYNHTVAVSSGTSACIAANISLYDFGACPGDEVIVPALSFIATANSIRAAGFTPKFCDVKSDMLIDESLIEGLITKKTRAIMPVSLMGKPPKMDVIRKIADDHNLLVIMDNCEGHGCQYNQKFMGLWADVVVYSCYAAHILFSGEMGFVSTLNGKIAEASKSIRSHGREPDSLYFDHRRYGLNLKPTDLHASIGLGNIDEFWKIFNIRKSNWKYLVENLKEYSDLLWMSDEDEQGITSPHGFSITVKPGNKLSCLGLKKIFDENEIDWKRNFGSMPTQHKCFSYLNYNFGDFPKAEYFGDNGVHLGVHQFLKEKDLVKIVKSVKSYIDTAHGH
jgi:dTDP-4-amino-4,6-dideoxygalactose transaminase